MKNKNCDWISDKKGNEFINNIDDLKKVYYRNNEKYIKPVDYLSSVKAIQPLFPLHLFNGNKRIIPEDRMIKLMRRNILESQDIFFNDSLMKSSIEESKEYERMKQRNKIIEYQKELLKQIEEKKRRENEEQKDNHHCRSRKSVWNINNNYLQNKIIRKRKDENIVNNEKNNNEYPQIIEHFQRMFQSIFQEHLNIINEYKNDVQILKKELSRIANLNRDNTQVNEVYNDNNTNYNIASSNRNDKSNEEESSIIKLKGVLFKSKYEDKSIENDSLPSSSKMVKKIGETHLIETWVNNDCKDTQLNSKQEIDNKMINDNKEPNQRIGLIDSINDQICYPKFYNEEEEKINNNNDEIVVIRSTDYNNMKSISESTYYNPNLPEIDLNQIIDFSKNDSSNIETDSENKVTKSVMRNENEQMLSSSKMIENKKDSFMTKLTYFDNTSQIIHEKMAKSNKQIVNNEINNNTKNKQSSKQFQSERELFDNSLNTINEYIRRDNLKNTIELY